MREEIIFYIVAVIGLIIFLYVKFYVPLYDKKDELERKIRKLEKKQ